ncbi:MAG: M28 family metallopeptidase [Bacteroidales bacterium]|nr:M28 family metallopeptidase [Bacteroidales bacterium]
MKKNLLFLWLILYPLIAAAQPDREIMRCISEVSQDSISSYISTLTGFHTRHNLSSRADHEKGIGAASRWLYQKVAGWIPLSGGRLYVENINYTAGGTGSRLDRQVELANVMAVLRGSGSQEILLLAHYDSRVDDNSDSTSFAPGANDNGSGVACLLESIRVMAGIPLQATVRFLFLSGEEHGLLGAACMADMARSQGWNVTAVINFDMIGNAQAGETGHRDNSRTRVFSVEGPSRELARYIGETAMTYVDNMNVALIYRNDRYGRGGDHTPFLKAGYTAVRICEFHENYDRTHQLVRDENGILLGDLPSGVDYEYVRRNTGIGIAAVMSLAKAPAAPVNVQMNIRVLSNYTELEWEPSSEPGLVKGYYVVIRETDQSRWQKRIYTEETRIRIPYSKDNYFFGICAVGPEGHQSLVSVAD